MGGKKIIRVIIIVLGFLLAGLYTILTNSEIESLALLGLYLLPIVIWPFVAYRWPYIGAAVAFVFGFALTAVFLNDFLARSAPAARDLLVFIGIVPVPAVIISGLLIYSAISLPKKD